MGELSKLPNIGPEIEKQLTKVGISTPAELAAAGSMESWLRIKASDDSACFNRLCSVEGAIRGIKKTELPQEVKENLKAFYLRHK